MYLCHDTKRCNDLCFIVLKITSSGILFPRDSCTNFFVINFYLTKLYLLNAETDSSSPVYLEIKKKINCRYYACIKEELAIVGRFSYSYQVLCTDGLYIYREALIGKIKSTYKEITGSSS
jgi:hypothetical protein